LFCVCNDGNPDYSHQIQFATFFQGFGIAAAACCMPQAKWQAGKRDRENRRISFHTFARIRSLNTLNFIEPIVYDLAYYVFINKYLNFVMKVR
jgi:hypothetical protein